MHQISAQPVDLQDHEVIFHRSKIDIKLYKEGEILFLHKGGVSDLIGSSPISAKDSVIKYYVFGPRDGEVRGKVAKKIAERLGVSATAISHLA